ncbi:MAG TPA: hypothetical protein VGL39_11760 [Jatrophihabitantaceae bacterium]|jgi:hypothetical protein
MGTGTSFDPNILDDACDALTRIDTIIKDSASLKNINEDSSITSDVSGLDDTKGGWKYVDDQVSGVGTTVAQYVTDLHTTAGQVHQAMQASINTLTGADTSSASTVTQSGYGASDPGNAPAGRG